MTKIIGLTGPTGSGKSVAAFIAKGMKIRVIDCDKVARTAVKKGSDGLKALTDVFGMCILNKDGTLNRKDLARRAFASKENTELLNKTIFPYITELVNKQIKGKLVLLDAPTLFESGINSICDVTVAVLSDRETRLERIMARDNISKEFALLRINAGKPDEFYRKRADYIIYNNGNLLEYKKEMVEIFNKYTEE